MLSIVEENYIKALLKLSSIDRVMTRKEGVGTNDLAAFLKVKPSTVNEMLKRLKEKKLVNHEKYKKVTLTSQGESVGLRVIRKHRLWETFLYTKLEFEWDEVHDIAEQLEHIQSEKLIEKMDTFLGHPKFDPHGDPIPNGKGVLPQRNTQLLSTVSIGTQCTVLAVTDTSKAFLKYLEALGIAISSQMVVVEKIDYDHSIKIKMSGQLIHLSSKVSNNILVG